MRGGRGSRISYSRVRKEGVWPRIICCGTYRCKRRCLCRMPPLMSPETYKSRSPSESEQGGSDRQPCASGREAQHHTFALGALHYHLIIYFIRYQFSAAIIAADEIIYPSAHRLDRKSEPILARRLSASIPISWLRYVVSLHNNNIHTFSLLHYASLLTPIRHDSRVVGEIYQVSHDDGCAWVFCCSITMRPQLSSLFSSTDS